MLSHCNTHLGHQVKPKKEHQELNSQPTGSSSEAFRKSVIGLLPTSFQRTGSRGNDMFWHSETEEKYLLYTRSSAFDVIYLVTHYKSIDMR